LRFTTAVALNLAYLVAAVSISSVCEWPAVTVIVAAYNEQEAIEPTLDHIAASRYQGALTVVLADNNSTDRTAELAEAAARRHAGDPASAGAARGVLQRPGWHQGGNLAAVERVIIGSL
jgi:cellulose synthase/poly-beta-1,6-N-acetylglucosamine synthase-like glycosyltransferase